MTHKDKKDRITYLNDRLTNGKNPLCRNEDVLRYLVWEKLSPLEKKNLAAKWEGYYIKVRQTETFKEYRIALEALRDGDLDTVKKMAKRASERKAEGNWLPKPSSEDPEILAVSPFVQDYLKFSNELEKLQNTTALSAEEIFS